MGYFDGLGEINAQIQELEKKRAEIINRNNHLTEEDIKKLEWTKDLSGDSSREYTSSIRPTNI